MSNSKKSQRMKSTMEQLALMGSADLEGIRQDMRERGEDPDAIREKGMALVKRLKGQLKLSLAGAGREQTISKLEALREDAKRRVQETGENVIDLIRQLATGSGAELSVSFRKVEYLDEDEALELLTEAQLLQLLDELDNDAD